MDHTGTYGKMTKVKDHHETGAQFRKRLIERTSSGMIYLYGLELNVSMEAYALYQLSYTGVMDIVKTLHIPLLLGDPPLAS